MVVHRGHVPRVAPDWLSDDTEETVVGTEWHQEAIWGLSDMLRAVSERRGAAWSVCEQIGLEGLHHLDGRAFTPRPDVMVLAQPLSGQRASTSLEKSGTPLFVAEVASDSTLDKDREGKRIAYAAVGIPEYLIFDPGLELLPAPIEAWHLPAPDATVYVSWLPGADGLWHSQSLHVAIGAEQPLLAVRDRDDTPIESTRRVRRTLDAVREQLDVALGELHTTRGELEVERAVRRTERVAREALEEQLRQLRAQLGDEQ